MKNPRYVAATLVALGLSSLATQASALTGCMASVQKNGLMVGTSPDYPPFESLDSNNQIVGYDIDLINAIAKNMKVKVNVVGQSFDGLIPALLARKIDIIAAGMTVNDERKKAVNFTVPYDSSDNVIMTRKENMGYNTAAKLSGKTVGAQIGSTQEKLAQGIKGANAKSFNLYTDAAIALQTRQIDSMIIDKVVATNFAQTYPDLRIAGTLSKNTKAMAVRKDCTDITNRVNAAIIQLRKDGTLDMLGKKWKK